MSAFSGTSGAINPIGAPPPALKSLAPLLQRATELRTADAVLSYWCLYRAARSGIPLYAKLDAPAKTFLGSLMDSLESAKEKLKGDARVDDDDAGRDYVRARAMKVFEGADAEDRAGRASRNTARAFLASSNFFDVLSEFGELDEETAAKLKYSKWKAAEIAKAVREGRTPVPGPAGGVDAEEEERARAEAALSQLGLALPESAEEKEYIKREMAKLGMEADAESESAAPQQVPTAPRPATPDAGEPTAFSPDDEATPDSVGQGPAVVTPRARRAQSRLSVDAGAALAAAGISPGLSLGGLPTADSGIPPSIGSPNFSMPLRSQLSRQSSSDDAAAREGARSNASSVTGDVFGGAPPTHGELPQPPPGQPQQRSAFLSFPNGPGSTPIAPQSGSNRPLPTPPMRDGFPVGAPTRSSTMGLPSSFAGLPAGFAPQSGFTSPQPASYHTSPSAPPHAALPAHIPTPSAPAVPPAPAVPAAPAAAALPESLTPGQTAKVQKAARWAASALDYDDLETCRKQLREALDIVEGRSTGAASK